MSAEVLRRVFGGLGALVAVGCGSGTGGSEVTTGAMMMTTTTAGLEPTSSGGTTGVDPAQFGFVCVRPVKPALNERNLFAGTATIRVRLHYEQCLIDYYTKRHPEHALAGSEGPALVEAWRERLCEEPIDAGRIPCVIEGPESFLQSLEEEPTPVHQMTITYTVLDDELVDDRVLLWGPVPLAEFAECPPGQAPSVKVSGPTDVVGAGSGGGTLWTANEWVEGSAVAGLDTSECINVEVSL